MNLNGPKRLSWWMALLIWVGVIIGVLGIMAQFGVIAALASSAFWLLAIGFALLAIAAAVIYLAILSK